jgi:hypothetical protein
LLGYGTTPMACDGVCSWYPFKKKLNLIVWTRLIACYNKQTVRIF